MICNRCGKEKPINEFCFRKKEQQYRNPCKECRKEYLKEYYATHLEYRKKYSSNYYQQNQQKVKDRVKRYALENEQKLRIKQKKYRELHKEDMHNYKVEYYKKNKEEIAQKSHDYYLQNADVIKEYHDNYAKENRKKINKYVRDRKEKDSLFKLKLQVRNMLWESFNRKGSKKNYSSEKILGCEWAAFMNHLLETYKNRYGYEWDGKEEVHIDHIIPLATAKSKEEIKTLCHYTNLQLLKGKDNLEKGAKTNWDDNK